MMFSGRPDPHWPVRSSQAAALQSAWEALPRKETRLPVPPFLGYRGCYLEAPSSGRWVAFGGVVTRSAGDRSENRPDPGRRFEKQLLATAPKGVVPHVEGLP